MTDTDPWIVDIDARTFEKVAIERSFELPVVLDFWATWCEPCQKLGPILEQRARDGVGRFLLAKVDIDKQPELAQALRVQGIPAVIAIVQGKLADGFEGALPPEEVDRFLDRVAPIDPNAAPGGQPSVADQARDLADAGQGVAAMVLLREHLTTQADDHAASLVLADLLLGEGNPTEARAIFDGLPQAEREGSAGQALLTRLEFAEQAAQGGDLDELRRAVEGAPNDFDARLALGKALLAVQDFAPALEELLEAVRLAPEGAAEEPKSIMLKTFELLGMEDPVANDYRFKLSLELFA